MKIALADSAVFRHLALVRRSQHLATRRLDLLIEDLKLLPSQITQRIGRKFMGLLLLLGDITRQAKERRATMPHVYALALLKKARKSWRNF